MNIEVNITDVGMQSLILQGPVTVTRSDARDDDGIDVIDTEIVAMTLTGEFMAMPTTLRINPEESSLGEVRAQDPSSCFLADSYFDVFIEITIGTMEPLINLEPVRLEAGNLQKLPPLFDADAHVPRPGSYRSRHRRCSRLRCWLRWAGWQGSAGAVVHSGSEDVA